jgi:hypothetical protein
MRSGRRDLGAERATITNKGAELAAMPPYPSDEHPLCHKSAKPQQDFIPLEADPDAAMRRNVLDYLPLPQGAKPLGLTRRTRTRNGQYQGQPGRHRQLHQFVLPGPDDRGRYP